MIKITIKGKPGGGKTRIARLLKMTIETDPKFKALGVRVCIIDDCGLERFKDYQRPEAPKCPYVLIKTKNG